MKSKTLLAFAILPVVLGSSLTGGPHRAARAVPGGSTATAPVIAAAGDISCYRGDDGEYSCRDKATSDILMRMDPDRVLVLGDGQYEEGSLWSYRTFYDDTWGRKKGITRPAPGNHEYHTDDASGYFDYFGAAAGPRGKGYYTFTLGTWRIIVLNSNCDDVACGEGSAQNNWLEKILAENPSRCSLAIFHHPRFASGAEHGNNTEVAPFWADLYAHHVDVILNGHEHNYERFVAQNPNGVKEGGRGIRQFVVGTGGRSLYGWGTVKRNSEVRNNTTFGVLKMTLHPDRYEWQFVPEAGKTFTDKGQQTCH